MEDKIYAILYKKVDLNDYNLFIPVSLITGTFIDNVFVDELGNTYLYFDNLDIPEENADYRVGMEINEKELLEEYEGDILENCKMYYFDETKNLLFLGMVNIIENKLDIVSISMNDIFDETTNSETVSENDSNSLPKILIEIDTINKLLNSNSLLKIFNFFKTIRDNYIEKIGKDEKYKEEIDKLKIDSKNTAANDVININTKKLPMLNLKFDTIIDMLKMEDLESIRSYLYDIKSQYIDLLEKDPEYKDEIENIKKEKDELPKIEVIEKPLIDVSKLYDQVTKKVIGQDEAVKEIISCITMDQYTDKPTEKNRAIIIGGTGTGKTLILDTISELLGIPMLKYDSTQLTMPGYVGQSLDDVLLQLLDIANGDFEKAEKGIVVFDEIDKKGSTNNYDVSGRGVLNTLLPFMDGTTYTLKSRYNFNTSNLSIFFTGAFTEVFKTLEKDNNTIGFNSNSSDLKYSTKATREDLVKFGEMPFEFIGRISNLIQLNQHTEKSLYNIFKYSDISPILSEKNKLSRMNVKLECSDDYLKSAASKALKLKIGGRSLKSIVEQSIKEARWKILSNPGKYKSLTLTSETVENPKKYILK